MFKLIKKSTYNCLESQYNNKCRNVAILEKELKKQQEFLSNLTRKLIETGAIIYSIASNKNGTTTYICIIDDRDYELKGSLDMFVINSEIEVQKGIGKYRDMPYLQSYFASDEVILQELHCDIKDNLYENLGYATMMVDALKRIAKDSKRFVISGSLCEDDAESEEKKNRRNNFYIKHGFSVKFDDESCKSGHIKLILK